MASSSSSSSSSNRPSLLTLLILLLLVPSHPTLAARRLTALVQTQPLALTYRNGQLLSGLLTADILWYGAFTPVQRAVITDFLAPLSSPPSSATKTVVQTSTASPQPSVAAWWKTVERYHVIANSPPPALKLGSQTLDQSCSLGKRLTSAHLAQLASKAGGGRGISVVLTASDVAVDGFCMNRCGTHASLPAAAGAAPGGAKSAYIWVGNPASQCPGQCAWPFHQPIYGPQTPPLVAPNGDVGIDGMVINLASLLAGTVTNPFGTGYFQGPKEAPLEAASACPGVYGKGAYPGYAGDLLVDSTTGASYNANGINGRKYLLPALVDPATAACLTLV